MGSESILDVTKQLCGIDAEDVSFDLDIVTHINTVLFVLMSLGVGPTNGFSITGRQQTWGEFTGEDNIHAVRSYMGLKVRMLFDPPTTGPSNEAMERQVAHLEWLLNIHTEGVKWDTMS